MRTLAIVLGLAFAVIAIIGFLITLVLNELERVIIPWKAE